MVNSIIANIHNMLTKEEDNKEMKQIILDNTHVAKTVNGKKVRLFNRSAEIQDISSYYLHIKRNLHLNYFMVYFVEDKNTIDYTVTFNFCGQMIEKLDKPIDSITSYWMTVDVAEELLNDMDINLLKEDITTMDKFFNDLPEYNGEDKVFQK